jgi:hypothetical protein
VKYQDSDPKTNKNSEPHRSKDFPNAVFSCLHRDGDYTQLTDTLIQRTRFSAPLHKVDDKRF